MIFTIAPLVQEAKTTRRWFSTLGTFTGVLLLVLGAFGAAMAWAGTAVAARVTTPYAREVIASLALTVIGALALAIAAGELGLTRRLLPRAAAAPPDGGAARERFAVVTGVAMALTGGYMLSMWALGATWALFL